MALENGLTARCSGGAWGGARAGKGLRGEGRAFFEVAVLRGLCRVGWSTAGASLSLGMDPGGFGFGGTGMRSHGGKFEPYGEAFSAGDVIGCFLAVGAGGGGATLAFSKNGRPLGEAFNLPQWRARTALYPTVCLRDAGAALRVNFGGSRRGAPFSFPPNDDRFIPVDALRGNVVERGKPRRVPEDVFHALSALGGAPGTLAGMLLANHKRSCERAGGARSAWFWGKPGGWWWGCVPAAAASCAVHFLLLRWS